VNAGEPFKHARSKQASVLASKSKRYRPIWTSVTLDDGSAAHAIAFVADESRAQFEADSSVDRVAPLIAGAAGAFGSNADYLMKLHHALRSCELRDPYVDALAAEVERLRTRAVASE
jgi:cation transport protein ChaC